MPPTRIDPADLSYETKRRILSSYRGIIADLDDDINGVQITIDGKDQPPTIDVRYV